MKKESTQVYFIFFCPKGISAHPIAMYYDKAKAVKHYNDHGNEYTELRMCGWTEGNLPAWSDTTKVDVPPPKKKTKKNENKDTVCTIEG